jgi:hypothetical protein
MARKSVRKGTTGDKSPPVPVKSRGQTGKKLLQTGGTRRESQKRPTRVVGWKPYGKSEVIPVVFDTKPECFCGGFLLVVYELEAVQIKIKKIF